MAGLLDLLNNPMLQGLVTPSDEDKRAARSQALLAMGAGLLGAQCGREGQALGRGLLGATNAYTSHLQSASDRQLEKLKLARWMTGADREDEQYQRQRQEWQRAACRGWTFATSGWRSARRSAARAAGIPSVASCGGGYVSVREGNSSSRGGSAHEALRRLSPAAARAAGYPIHLCEQASAGRTTGRRPRILCETPPDRRETRSSPALGIDA